MIFKPQPPQVKIIHHALDHPRCGVFAGMGMGKTASTAAVLNALYYTGETAPTLILAPKLVCETTWPLEIKKWDNFKDLSVTPILGNLKERSRALRHDTPLYAINYEGIPWLIDHYGAQWPFKTIVADESTRLKSFRLRQGGVRARALATVVHSKVDRFIALSGTPAPNGLQDLWGQIWMLDKGERLGRSFTAFTDRWFYRRNRHSSLELRWDQAAEDIQNRIGDICISLRPEDYYDLRKPHVSSVLVELPAKVRTLYDQMEKELAYELENHIITAANAAVKANKLLQIANGAAYVDPEVDTDDDPRSKKYKPLHDKKLQALESIAEETNHVPLLIAYTFRSDRERILKAFKQAEDIRDGGDIVERWNKGKIKMLLVHPRSAGHGLNLQDGGHHLVNFGHTWSLEETQQVLERIGPMRQQQAGYDRVVMVYNIVAADTMDSVVIERQEGKKSIQDALLERLS